MHLLGESVKLIGLEGRFQQRRERKKGGAIACIVGVVWGLAGVYPSHLFVLLLVVTGICG